MGCNSSNQVGSAPPNANLPSKQMQTEEEMAEKTVAAAKRLSNRRSKRPTRTKIRSWRWR